MKLILIFSILLALVLSPPASACDACRELLCESCQTTVCERCAQPDEPTEPEPPFPRRLSHRTALLLLAGFTVVGIIGGAIVIVPMMREKKR